MLNTFNPSEYIDIEPVNIFILVGCDETVGKEKVLPALWQLHSNKLLPKKFHICGYLTTKSDVIFLKAECEKIVDLKKGDVSTWRSFWRKIQFFQGEYETDNCFNALGESLRIISNGSSSNRIFSLAISPILYQTVTKKLEKSCKTNTGYNRIMLESRFGNDLSTFRNVTNHLYTLFHEDDIFAMDRNYDHEILQNLLMIRFGNYIFSHLWNSEHIASIKISFKQKSSPNSTFEEAGIIRDIVVNHLVNILTIVLMDKPFNGLQQEFKLEKLRLLKAIEPVNIMDVVLGQYIGDRSMLLERQIGYREENNISENSITPTYAMIRLHVCSKLWEGVPIILECGKALNEDATEVHIQFKDVSSDLYQGHLKRNALIVKSKHNEAVYVNLNLAKPKDDYGFVFFDEVGSKVRVYNHLPKRQIMDRMILDVMLGSKQRFIRLAEIEEAWRIFTPLLVKMEQKKIEPIPYFRGSSGPDVMKMLIDNSFLVWFRS